MASLSEFTENLRNTNVSRPYLFYATIIPPRGMLNNSLVSLYCNSAQTPALTLSADDYYDNGFLRPVVQNYGYQSLTLQFMVDMDYTVKEFFDDWMDKIILSRRVFAFPDDYTSEFLELNVINIENKDVYKYIFNRIYPTGITQVDLYMGGNGPAIFAVNFVFESFTHKRMQAPVDFELKPNNVTNPEVLQLLKKYKA